YFKNIFNYKIKNYYSFSALFHSTKRTIRLVKMKLNGESNGVVSLHGCDNNHEEEEVAYYPHEDRCLGPEAQVPPSERSLSGKSEPLWICFTHASFISHYIIQHKPSASDSK